MKKILIIDDERELTELMKDRLELEGFEVSCAYDGVEGLLLATQEKPELILLDLLIPKMDGQQVYQTLKKNTQTASIRVIVFTANNKAFDTYWEKEVGAFNYLVKPFDFNQLLRRIRGERRRGE
ncbi:MAG: response regulator [Deltaproteobacteria bacterium]|nr:response regulator [Deltaproteobacteria bacterium]